MQIELVGCTSAGKSTLVAQVTEAARAEGIDLLLADEFALDQLGLGHLRKRWLRAVVVHIVAFWGCVSKGWRHVRFVKFAYREAATHEIYRGGSSGTNCARYSSNLDATK